LTGGNGGNAACTDDAHAQHFIFFHLLVIFIVKTFPMTICKHERL
jgi:hypothetical protein